MVVCVRLPKTRIKEGGPRSVSLKEEKSQKDKKKQSANFCYLRNKNPSIITYS